MIATRAPVFLLLFTCLWLPELHAGNPVLDLTFGGDPGSPLQHAYNYGLPESGEPTYTLRIPMIDKDIKTVFYDTVLTISNPGKIVQRVTAERAFRTLTDCEKAREVVTVKFNKALPRDNVTADSRWQRQSADGTVVGRLACESLRHYPLPVLRFEIARTP